MPGHKRISGLSRRLPPLITLPRHGELSARRRHPSAALGRPASLLPGRLQWGWGTRGWAAPGVPDVGASELGCPELAVLGAMGAPEMGCPEWGGQGSPSHWHGRSPAHVHPPACTRTLTRAHAHTHVHTHVLRLCSPCTRCEGRRAWHGCQGKGHEGLGPSGSGCCCLPRPGWQRLRGAGGWLGSRGPRPCTQSRAPSDPQGT